jgi:uncharacterized phage protein (TIGR02218 family)
MSALLRACSPALAAALADGGPLWAADLFVFTLADGVTQYHWTSWDRDLVAEGVTYASRDPWLSCSGWSVTNTLEVTTSTITMAALNGAFNGGANLKTQIHNGLFDGASVLISEAYMTTPGDAGALGPLPVFGGKVGAIDLTGAEASLTVNSKVNDLAQNVPRNLYQIGCNHSFCDAGCTLNRAAFTAAFAVGSSPAPTSTFIPWASAPGDPVLYAGGWVAFTSGAASGSRRTVLAADSEGLTLAYPLYQAPAAGDAFTAFEGCDKTFNSGSGQSCADRGNTQHYRGFEFVPPPNSSW